MIIQKSKKRIAFLGIAFVLILLVGLFSFSEFRTDTVRKSQKQNEPKTNTTRNSKNMPNVKISEQETTTAGSRNKPLFQKEIKSRHVSSSNTSNKTNNNLQPEKILHKNKQETQTFAKRKNQERIEPDFNDPEWIAAHSGGKHDTEDREAKIRRSHPTPALLKTTAIGLKRINDYRRKKGLSPISLQQALMEAKERSDERSIKKQKQAQ